MASELSKFIEDELKDKGWQVDDEEAPQQALLGALRVEARVKEKQTSRKIAMWKRGICVGGGIVVVILVWLLIMKLGSTTGDVILFSPPPPPEVESHQLNPTPPAANKNSTQLNPRPPDSIQHKSAPDKTRKETPKPVTPPAPKSPKPANRWNLPNKNGTIPNASTSPAAGSPQQGKWPDVNAMQSSPAGVASKQENPSTGEAKEQQPPDAQAQHSTPAPAKSPEVPVAPKPKPVNGTADATGGLG